MATGRGDGRCRSMGRSSSLKYIPGVEELSSRGIGATAQDRELLLRSLRENPNLRRFAPFADEHLNALVDTAWREDVAEGQELMVEGDLDNLKFWVVAEGSFEVAASEPFDVVTLNGMSYLSRPELPSKPKSSWSVNSLPTVRQVGARSSFGDSSMVYGAPRWARVTALERSIVWVISQADFKLVQRQAMHAIVTEKSQDDVHIISRALQVNANLQQLTPLTPKHIDKLISIAFREVLPKGKVLMTEGDLNADMFYIVGEGSLEFCGAEPFEVANIDDVSYLVRAAHSGQALSSRAAETTVRVCSRGLCFGEISMLYCAPRFATVTALEDSVLWAIDRASFQMVQMTAAEDEMKNRIKFLEQLEILKGFAREDREKVAALTETVRLSQNEVITSEGEESVAIYILYEGSAVDDFGVAFEADAAKGTVHIFGEDSFRGRIVESPKAGSTRSRRRRQEVDHSSSSTSDCCLPCWQGFFAASSSTASPEPQPTGRSFKVSSARATALVLERDAFKKIWDRLIEAAPAPAFKRYETLATKEGRGDESLSIESLERLGLLGCSSLGPVELCKHKTTKELYALKRVSKCLIVQRGLRKSIMREKMLWTEVMSPFIIRVVATFNEPQHLAFLLEAALGGELSSAYVRENLHGSAQHARFYAAGVVLALEHLHKRRIVYRNLKPSNIMLSLQGHPKITDMGLAKLVVGHTFTTCGTPTYMAPEVLAGVGHHRAADWWSLGVLVFELLSGQSPFHSSHPMEVYAKILRGIARVELPSSCEGEAGNLIKELLTPLAIDRLAMRQGGIKNVMDHAWFSGFEWQKMRASSLKPPYVPGTGQEEPAQALKRFEPRSQNLPGKLEYTDDLSGWDEDFAS